MIEKHDEMRVSILLGMLQEDFKHMPAEDVWQLMRSYDIGENKFLKFLIDKHGFQYYVTVYDKDNESFLVAWDRFDKILYNRIRANRRKAKKA